MIIDENFIYTFDKNNYLMKVIHESFHQYETLPKSASTHYFRIILVQEGSASIQINEKPYTIEKNDIIIINNTEKYEINSVVDTKGLLLFIMEFEPSFISSMDCYSFDLKYLKIFIDRSEHFQNIVSRNNPETIKILSLIRDIESEFQRQYRNHKLMSKVHLLHILVLLSRNYNYINRRPQAKPFSKEKILGICKVIDYINDNISNQVTLAQLTRLSNMSQSSFCNVFKELNGIPPMEYLKRKRIAYGIQLLNSTDKTVLDIALSCGFNNTSNFNRTFKQLIGKTPKEIRNQK